MCAVDVSDPSSILAFVKLVQLLSHHIPDQKGIYFQ